MAILAPPAKALAQLDDPVFVGVIMRSILWTVIGFAALTVAVVWGAHHLVAANLSDTWVSWAAGLVGGAGAVVLALYFFIAVVTVVATLFIEPVANAVERRFYPFLPPPQPAPMSQQVWDGIALGIRVLILQVLGLVLTIFIPGVGAIIGWAIAAWAIGRGLFVAVAMRRMDRAQATALYNRLKLPVFVQGALIAAGSLIPLLNLAVPVLGTAAMVHVFHDEYDRYYREQYGRQHKVQH